MKARLRKFFKGLSPVRKALIVGVSLFFLFTFFPTIYLYVHEHTMHKPKCDISAALANYHRAGNAGCIILQDDKILLVKLAYNDKITIPGGTSERGEMAPCTAHRETFEETGVDVTVVRNLFVANNGFHFFLCEAKTPIDLSYSKKFEIDHLLLIKPMNIDSNEYNYPKQLSILITLVEELRR